MYFVITSELKDGVRTRDIDIYKGDDFAHTLASQIKRIREGYIQYVSYRHFNENPQDEPAKRMLLASGSVMQ